MTTVATAAGAGSGPVAAGAAAAGQASGTGMLRDWKFSIQLSHKNARARLSYLPRWEGLFIDVDDVESNWIRAAQSDMHKMLFAPLRKFVSFRDVTPALRVGEHYQEIPKDVNMFYVPIAPNSNHREFVKHCVRYALHNPNCVEVDGDTNTKHLRIGKKMQCGNMKIGGISTTTFQFSYTVTYKATLSSEYHQVFGGIVGDMGYVVSTMCTQKDELEAYFEESIIPHIIDPKTMTLNTDVEYAETSHFGLQRQQELFGELKWMDTDAALAFSMPMHPLILKPDYSPIQSVGAGTNACLSIDLSVYQKLADELSEREVTGMPKYKANQVLLFLEVEDAAEMGYGSSLSIEEYCLQKAKRVKDTFPDLREVGSHVNQDIGPRTGRSTTCTFTYDVAGTKLSGSVVKAMLASTLVGNNGVTVLYFTKVGQGLFDAHLYLYQQLLRTVTFYHERQLTAKFSRHQSATVIRLKDQDLDKVYPKLQREMIDLHARSLHAASDGFVEGATLICIGDPAKKKSGVTHEPTLLTPQVTTSFTAADVDGQEPIDDGEDQEEEEEEETEEQRELREAEEDSVISVTEIKHLITVEAWEDADDDMTIGPASMRHEVKSPGASNRDGSEDRRSGDTPAGTDIPEPADSKRGSVMSGTTSVNQTPAVGGGGGGGGGGSRPGSSRDRNSIVSPLGASQGERPATGEGSRPGTRDGTGRLSTTGVSDDSSRLSPAGPTPQDGGAEDKKDADKGVEEIKEMTAEEIDALTRDVEDTTRGPNLHQCYIECCEQQQCRPNSYLLKKLPTHPRFVASIEELDMASNYLGHSGFVAILHFLTYLKKVHTIHFNDMSLDNSDIDSLCTILMNNSTVTTLHLKNNPKISLPSVRRFSQLLSGNRRLKCITLGGAAMSDALIARLEGQAAKNEAASAQLIAEDEAAEAKLAQQQSSAGPSAGMFRRQPDSPKSIGGGAGSAYSTSASSPQMEASPMAAGGGGGGARRK